MATIKPIETEYKGYKFRSRLEARWAVFFDACGVKWEYEPEGFDLGDGLYYLPDFLLHDVVCRYNQGNELMNLWVEVKGEMTPEDAFKIYKFRNPILVFGNVPDGEEWWNMKDAIWDMNYDSDYSSYAPLFGFDTIDGDCYTAYPMITKKGQFVIVGGNYMDDTIDEKATYIAYKKALQTANIFTVSAFC